MWNKGIISTLIAFLLLTVSCSKSPSEKWVTDIGHPRILLLEGEEQALKNAVSGNPVWEKMHNVILAECDKILELPPLERIQIGRRLLDKSREALRRIFYLSYAYRMTGDEKYFNRAEKEMLVVSGFSDWNPSHFLDVGEMTMALAIGYDWLYDNLSEESRALIREAILKKGLEPSFDSTYNWFLRATHNWNQVCNAGMFYGALAIAEDHPEIAKQVIDRALQTIHLPMEDYEPDGAYPEGYGYWNYGTTFNVMLLSALDKVLPDRFDYSKHPGYMKTGSFLRSMLGPSGNSYNWGDAGGGGSLNPAMFWFAQKNNDPSLLWMEKMFLARDDYSRFGRDRILPAMLIWGKDLDPGQIVEPTSKMFVGQGPMPVALMRTSWSDPAAVYLGFKAGSPSVNHGHMDVGSFIMEADGIRWAIDAGSQDYESLESRGMKIFGREQDAQRWTVLRLNNNLHNTLMVNNQQQRVEGYAKIDKFTDQPGFMAAITDLSAIYKEQLAKVTRGAAIVDERYVVIRDEIQTGTDQTTIRWKMLTTSEVKLSGKNRATLMQEGKTLHLVVDSPPDARVVTWSSQPTTDYDAPNPGTLLVGFETAFPSSTPQVIQVRLIPGNSVPGSPVDKTLDNW